MKSLFVPWISAQEAREPVFERTIKPRFCLAIAGCGQITAQTHLPAALSCDDIDLVALVDPVIERARDLARKSKINPIIAEKLSDVLDRADGVVIATPNYTHCELALECLQAAVPVLVEKPLATTVLEGEAIVAAAKAHNTPCAVGYATRFGDSVRLMGALLESGYFGRPLRFVYQFGSTGNWSPLSGYTLDRQATGGGVLVVTGTHFLDRMLHWFGYPSDFDYQDDSLGGPEANAVATFRYSSDSGVLEGVARFSKTVSLKPGFVLQTEKGVVVLGESQDSPVVFHPSNMPQVHATLLPDQQQSSRGVKSIYKRQLENFVEVSQSNGVPLVSAYQGLQSLRLIEGLYARRRPLEANRLDREEVLTRAS